MPVTRDIAATYRGPRKVMQRLLDMGQREDRALIFVMAACVITFIAQWPYLARRAHLEDVELNGLLAGSLMAWIIAVSYTHLTLPTTLPRCRARGGGGR